MKVIEHLILILALKSIDMPTKRYEARNMTGFYRNLNFDLTWITGRVHDFKLYVNSGYVQFKFK